jgi:penicillin-binding protein 2
VFAQVRDSPKLYQPTDEIGIAGVEASFEDVLRGTPQREVIEVDAGGNRVGPPLSKTEAVPGNDVRLTIDINLQALVEKELAAGIRSARQRVDESGPEDEENEPFNAPGGAFVLLDPDGSRVLATASFPTYDQRVFLGSISERDFGLLRDDETAPLLDRASAGAYAPGSTFKLITAYAALDAGLLGDRGFLKRAQFLTDNGSWTIPRCAGAGCVLRNAGDKELGDVDLELAITESSNVFFGQLGYQFDVRQGFQSQQLVDIAEDFGYGLRYAAIPGAQAGSVPLPETAGQTANMAVGQGFLLASPLQVANSYAAIANGGKVYSPMLAEAVIDAVTEDVVIDFKPRLIHQLYMPDEFRQPLVDGMLGVTSVEGGTAYEAFENFARPSFQICGKTGTVENPPKQDNAAFAAFAPCRNPQYSAIAYIEQAGLGGDAAAPIVRAVFEAIATNDIDVVPTEAEAEELISEADALAAEEERLQTEAEAAAADEEARIQAELAEQNPEGEGDFAVLVPGADTEDARGDEGDPDVLVLVPDEGDS